MSDQEMDVLPCKNCIYNLGNNICDFFGTFKGKFKQPGQLGSVFIFEKESFQREQFKICFTGDKTT